jgi:hypothetical protein
MKAGTLEIEMITNVARLQTSSGQWQAPWVMWRLRQLRRTGPLRPSARAG